MNLGSRLPVLAFADNHIPYNDLGLHSELDIKFCCELDSFFTEALSKNYCGVIMEMKKVMQLPAKDRNNIFNVAADVPLLRTKASKYTVQLVDNPDIFRDNCKSQKVTNLRQFERAEVNIQVLVSPEDDHAMARIVLADVINLSEAGCLIRTRADLSANRFIHIKFHALSNKLPIYGAIRWTESSRSSFRGYGIQFVSIRQDQRTELVDRYIRPYLDANPATHDFSAA
ncbi:PilZ domain-containing protein [Maridesulfovibrio sp. FT414]|uniref:PilZ domain-containing protein n=1 Tax=Maridesulfovibrio sp. FT414 TaxID=2979469 RepID=UPI003D8073ED